MTCGISICYPGYTVETKSIPTSRCSSNVPEKSIFKAFCSRGAMLLTPQFSHWNGTGDSNCSAWLTKGMLSSKLYSLKQ
jgi:hypothetical protein